MTDQELSSLGGGLHSPSALVILCFKEVKLNCEP